jgi:hypothetical protein
MFVAADRRCGLKRRQQAFKVRQPQILQGHRAGL